jgi:hypothetical protein
MVFSREPYPFYHKGSELIRISVLLFVIGYLFEYLIVTFPRDPDEHLYSYAIITLVHVGVAVMVYFFYFLLVSQFIEEDDWTLGKELLAVFGLLLFIGIGEWGVRPLIYEKGGNLSFYTLYEEVWHAMLSGGLIYLLVTLVNTRMLRNKHQHESKDLPHQAPQKDRPTILIKSNLKSEHLQLNVAQFICARAEGNYLELFIKEETEVTKKLIRLSLQRFLEQLQPYRFIQKTHRAFVVNTGYIRNASGNAQGYLLEMEHLDFSVPVSRQQLPHFKKSVGLSFKSE